MTPWTDEELQSLRETQEAFMPEKGTVMDVSTTDDDRGGQTDAYTPRAEDVPLRLGNPGYRERQNIQEQFRGSQIYVATLPAGTPVEAGDRLIVNETTYEVAGVNAPESYDTAVRVYLRKAS